MPRCKRKKIGRKKKKKGRGPQWSWSKQIQNKLKRSKLLPKQDNDHSDFPRLTGLQHQILSKYNNLKCLIFQMNENNTNNHLQVSYNQFRMTINIVELIEGVHMRSVFLYVDPASGIIEGVGKLNKYPLKIISANGQYKFLPLEKHKDIPPIAEMVQPRDGGSSTSTKRGRCLVLEKNDIIRLEYGENYRTWNGNYVEWKQTSSESIVADINAPPLINFGVIPSEVERFSSIEAAMNCIVCFFNFNVCIGCKHKFSLSVAVQAQKNRLDDVCVSKNTKNLKKLNNICFASKSVPDSSIRVVSSSGSSSSSKVDHLMYTEYKNGLLLSPSSLPSSSKWSIRPNTCCITVDKHGTSCNECKAAMTSYLKDSHEKRVKSTSEKFQIEHEKKQQISSQLKNLKERYKRLEKKFSTMMSLLKVSQERASELEQEAKKIVTNDTSAWEKVQITANAENTADPIHKLFNLDDRINIIDDAAATLMVEVSKNGYISKNKKNMEVAAALLSHQADMYKRAKLSKDKRGIRYSDKVFSFAVAIERASPGGYEMLRKVMTLPTRRHLKRAQYKAPSTDGVAVESVNILCKQLKQISDEKKNSIYKFKSNEKELTVLAASLDAMVLRTGVYYDSNTDQIVGFVGEKVLNMKELVNGFNHHFLTHKDLARYCSVLMVSTTGEVHHSFPLGAWFTNTLTSRMCIQFVQDAVVKLALFDMVFISLACDGASENRAMINELATLTVNDILKILEEKNITKPVLSKRIEAAGDLQKVACQHPYFDDILVFFISDPPHLLKKLAGCLLRSSDISNRNKKMTRNMKYEDKNIDINIIRKIYNDDKHNCQLLTYTLDPLAIYPTPWSRMRVYLAYQLFSSKLIRRVMHEVEKNNKSDFTSLLLYMQNINKMWDVLNNRSALPHLNDKWKELADSLDWFFAWLDDCEKPGPSLTDGGHRKNDKPQFITYQSWMDMQLSCTSMPMVVAYYYPTSLPDALQPRPRAFNQDNAEQFFSQIRQGRGSNDSANDARSAKIAIQFQRNGGSTFINSSIGDAKRGNVADGKEFTFGNFIRKPTT